MKLILFIHGLGGNKNTWGNFEDIIFDDNSFDEKYKIEFYEYDTSLLIAKGILPYFGWIGKIISIIAPKSPKIQDVAQQLHTDIDGKYKDYNKIYLAVHSMGGLVALKYITTQLNQKRELKIKKLLLFDVPNQGSHLAKCSSIYNHSQIIQLDKSSDFLDSLSDLQEFKDIEQSLKVQCLICQDDIVVDKISAKAHYKDVYELNKTHTSIVKPETKDDESYIFFRNFMIDKKECNSIESDKEFVKDIFNNLSNEIYVLLHQNSSHISSIVDKIYKKAKKRFETYFYHFIAPQTTKAKYYQKLGELIGKKIKNATEFIEEMGEIAQNQKVLLYINNFEENSNDRAKEMATAIRNLKDNHPNFHAIIIGKEKLAQMTYRTDSRLSPLNNSIKKIFPNNTDLEKSDIYFLINSLNENEREDLKSYLNSDNIGDFDISDRLKMKLFWANIVNKNSQDKLCWKDDRVRDIFRNKL